MKTTTPSASVLARSIAFSAYALALLVAPPGWTQSLESPAAIPSVDSSKGLPRIANSRVQTPKPAETIASRPAKLKSGKNVFETYVEDVTGSSLKIFGADLFGDASNTFAPFDAAQVNPDYVIGPGDALQIRGWGMVDIDLNATVDRSGAIYVPRVGSVTVAGVKYRDLQGYLKTAIHKIFSNFELSVSVSQTRAVQIYVVGNAVRPGTYTLNAMSTLLNALFSSGGPDASGSMRNIQLKRAGKTVSTFDVYDMLLKGDKSRDISLQDGDVIYIPEVGPLVALTGNVKKPGIFELKGQSSLADALNWAGGFDSAADMKQVVIEKNVDNNYQLIAELVANDDIAATRMAGIPMRPTDIVRVFSPGAVPVQAQVRNEYVRVAGEVQQSGVFQIKKGETLRELIARLGINENAYLYAMQLKRESVQRAQQAKLDEVADRFERQIEASSQQRLSGSTDAENVAIVAAEAERQRGMAKKMREIRAEGRIVLELADANAEVKHLPDLALQNGDSIYVPRKPGTVDVLGAVFQQSTFIYKPRRTVSDYLAMAGGATATADGSEIYVLRADGTAQSGHSKSWLSGIGGSQVNPGDTIVVPEKIDRSSFRQSFKEWTTILYQFGLGAAGLKVLKD